MSSGKQKRFDGQRWYERQLRKRTREALAERNRIFEQEHRNATDMELIEVIRSRAEQLGHIPRSVEVIGATLICSRFGSWADALMAAGFSYPRGPKNLTDSQLYKEEYARQQEIYRAEKEAKEKEKAIKMMKKREQK
ncbi:MAG: hypothetical protein IJH99_03175 [Eubacterium sp.]|nr:hypothetical protein [Eubacterium sp.]